MIRVSSIAELHRLLKTSGPRHPLITLLDLSTLVVDQEMLNTSVVLDLFSITLKTKVVAPLAYGRSQCDFDNGTLLCTEPGQLIKARGPVEAGDMAGWALYFHPDFLIKHPLFKTIRQYHFFAYEIAEALHLSEEERKSLTDIANKIDMELTVNIDDFSQDIQLANIDVLLNYINRYFNRQFITRKNINQQILTKVHQALDEYYATANFSEQGLPTVAYLAEQVYLSPKYMSDLLKKETGNNAQEIIHNYILQIAKYRLLNSSQSIAEISRDLGFEYQQYFSRIFKQYQNVTPNEFRKCH